jgi:pilus assembly protein Flp/PilA
MDQIVKIRVRSWHVFRFAVVTFDAGVAGRLVHADASIQGFFFGVFIMFQSIAAKLIGRFVRDQRGATMVEYGLLVALVAVAVIAAVTTLGGSINSFFQSADDGLNGV